MGQALLRGWLADGRKPASVRVVDPDERARSAVGTLGIEASSARPHSFRADVIVLAVKPHLVEGALQDYMDLADGRAMLLTIAAGKTIAFYQDLLGPGAAIVRGMPNTPAAIGKGITALAANEVVGSAQRQLCESLMAAVGQVLWLEDDGLMDSVTAVSGSGPAYVFLLIECLAAAAVKVGFEKEPGRTSGIGDGCRRRRLRHGFGYGPGGTATPGHQSRRHHASRAGSADRRYASS